MGTDASRQTNGTARRTLPARAAFALALLLLCAACGSARGEAITLDEALAEADG